MIYIASPYSHPEEKIRVQRFNQVEAYTVASIIEGSPAFSPIVYCHALAEKYNLPKDAKFWHNFNMQFLRHSSTMHYLKLDGHETSLGMQAELSMAQNLNIPCVEISRVILG